ncbi:MAG: hypothetical protein M3457_09725, partial [Chloroflexota bacterium]|nr:hypothetical protein [Chloroflexota bacterium]
GEPFMLELKPDGKRMSADEAVNIAMTRVAAMLPEEYRGIYGGARSDIGRCGSDDVGSDGARVEPLA